MWEKGGRNYISEFVRKLSTSYVKYFNGKYKRTGGLFEGSFKSIHLKNDNQAKYLFSYIHLNPVKLIQKDWKETGIKNLKGALEFLNNYKWSSYFDFTGVERKENKILNIEDFPKYFDNIKDFNKEILGWLKNKK
jgi:putative transposase